MEGVVPLLPRAATKRQGGCCGCSATFNPKEGSTKKNLEPLEQVASPSHLMWEKTLPLMSRCLKLLSLFRDLCFFDGGSKVQWLKHNLPGAISREQKSATRKILSDLTGFKGWLPKREP